MSRPYSSFTLAPSRGRVIECRLLEEVLLAVARKFREVKFIKILSTTAVENWPDRNLPTLFVYNDGELKTQLLTIKKLGGRSTTAKGTGVGLRDRFSRASPLPELSLSKSLGVLVDYRWLRLHRSWGNPSWLQRASLTLTVLCFADLEWWLASQNIVETEMEENPRKEGTTIHRGAVSRGYAEDDDEEDDS
jgi:hypothetical protein